MKISKVSSGPYFFNIQVISIKKEQSFEVGQHFLVPKHSKLSAKDKKELLENYKITSKELPRISVNDPAIAHLGAAPGDLVMVERKSPTSKISLFYRKVVK